VHRRAGSHTVFKQAKNTDAQHRLDHERKVLERLSGLKGIVKRVDGAGGAESLELEAAAQTLAEHLAGGPMPVERLLSFLVRLVSIVADMHAAGVVHLDINPSNILLTESEEPVLIDFGLALLADDRESEPISNFPRTLSYLAPEQSGRTGRAIDQRSDLYSLGVTLYEAATGRLPFDATDSVEVIRDHLLRDPEAPSKVNPHVPHALSDIILRLLAKAPEQRYQSAEGLLHDLSRLRQRIAGGQSTNFVLGEHDFPARLSPPGRLVGREREIETLRIAFGRAQHSAQRTILVEGSAGVGKSALVDQLRPIADSAVGWFVRSKFDPYRKHSAAGGAVAHALRELVGLLLAQPSAQLDIQRPRIVAALGPNTGFLTRLFPELRFLLGVRPESIETDVELSEAQLQAASVRLLTALVSPERPLVLVLDDLQWADELSLRAFAALMDDPEPRGLLLVGTFRNEDIGAQGVFSSQLERWQSAPIGPERLRLANLPEASMCEFLSLMLRLSPHRAAELSSAIWASTRGNPFDTVEVVNALKRGGALKLSSDGWVWDEGAIRDSIAHGDVTALVRTRIERQTASVRELLECMACLGHSVPVPLLAVATARDEESLRMELLTARDDGWVAVDGLDGGAIAGLRHDKVHEAILEGMAPARRFRLHRDMARNLAAQPLFEDEAAQQFFACAAYLDEPSDRLRGANLLYVVSRKLANAASHLAAERYLRAAHGLLAGCDDREVESLRGKVAVGVHAALFSQGLIDEADLAFAGVQDEVANPIDLGQAAFLQVQSLNMRGLSEEATGVCVRAFEKLSFKAPVSLESREQEALFDALRGWVAEDALRDPSSRPVMVDERILSVSKLLYGMQRAAFMRNDMKAFAAVLLASQRLWRDHGPCAHLLPTICWLGSLLISTRQDYVTGFRLGHHALTVGAAKRWEPQTSLARMQFANSLSHWFEPLEKGIEHCMAAQAAFAAAADIPALGNIHLLWARYALDVAEEIAVPRAILEAGVKLCDRSGNLNGKAHTVCILRFLTELRGDADARDLEEATFDQAAFLESVRNFRHLDGAYFTYRALADLLMGDLPMLRQHAAAARAGLHDVPGHFMLVHVNLTYGLALAWEIQGEPARIEDAPLHHELQACLDWFAARAADQPENFLHLAHLVDAEAAWARRDQARAAKSFDDALSAMERTRRPWQRALIAERAGAFHLAAGWTGTGRLLITTAYRQFDEWGAGAKTAKMRSEYDFLDVATPIATPTGAPTSHEQSVNREPGQVRPSEGSSLDSLDLVGVLRASQALSSETGTRRLKDRVTEMVTALSGAEKVLLLSFADGKWSVHAGEAGSAAPTVDEAIASGMLPASVFSYVERTQETLVVDDALSDNRFGRDTYFSGMRVCSVLMAPIAGQGGVRIMLYLENARGRAAFNARRLDSVKLIAGQLAVSFANAQLYESLEERVRARTRELEVAQEKLVAIARRAGMAEVANNVLHNVGNVLNSVNVSVDMVRRAVENSRVEGLARAVGLMNAHRDRLGTFLDSDPRGQKVLPYLDSLVAVVDADREQTLADLDRLVRSVDHIKHVIAAQQSHAGPSSFFETLSPVRLVEESIRLAGDVIASGGVRVVRDYQDVPEAELDKSRMLQILVNLIDNGTRAMENSPSDSRQLTLSVGAVAGTEGPRLRIRVQDAGLGIARENLTRIFAHGFTTRRGGHGFGLHSSALAAREMGGSLTAESEGEGHGCAFILELPLVKVGAR
jgi:predicted ATPase/signal transduction histidine kinase